MTSPAISFDKKNAHNFIRTTQKSPRSTASNQNMWNLEKIRIDRNSYGGALSGLNSPQFFNNGHDVWLASEGYVLQKDFERGVVWVEVAIPIYAGNYELCIDELIVELACDSNDQIGNHKVVEIIPAQLREAQWEHPVFFVKALNPCAIKCEVNPFDYSQVRTVQGLDEKTEVKTQGYQLTLFDTTNSVQVAANDQVMGKGKAA